VLAAALAALSLAALASSDRDAPEAPPVPEPSVASSVAVHAGDEGWFFLPAAFWLPETRAGLALGTGRDYRLEGAPRASNVFVVGGLALGGQGSIDAATDVYLREGGLLTGRLRFVYYPDFYYGIGPESSKADRERYTRSFVDVVSTAEYPFIRELRAGVRLVARAEGISDVTPGGALATSGLPGLGGFSAIGVGPLVTWDTRDRPLWPSAGGFAQAFYVRYPSAIARNDGFGQGRLDLRRFDTIARGWIVGTSAVLETSDGAIPFQIMPKLGNSQFFRGYPEGRFRDRFAWAAQTELRVELTPKLAAVAFGAIGDVAPNLAALGPQHLKAAGGAGARWRLTREGANLRFDVAAGAEGPELYLLLLEAF